MAGEETFGAAITIDGRYNAVRYGDGKKMGTSATQAITTATNIYNDTNDWFYIEFDASPNQRNYYVVLLLFLHNGMIQ